MSNCRPTLGWDLGGAHLKAVLIDADGRALQAFQRPCPLWRGVEHLERAVTAVMDAVDGMGARHAVTMTGELVDIFASRDAGVTRLAQCMADNLRDADLRIYAGRHGFVAAEAVPDHSADIASANWHASAAFIGAQVGDALFVDIGSTTADLIPLPQGKLAARGYSDGERLRYEELVYTGAVRTPVMAVAQRAPFAGEWQRLAAEHFATMSDVYRLTGDLPDGYDMAETADGAGKSPEESARRLARMVGRDLADAPLGQWRGLALAIKSQQMHMLQTAAERALSRGVLADAAPLVGAGVGSFLVRGLAHRMGREYRAATTLVPAVPEAAEWAAVCLPAYAVAWLAIKGAPCAP